MNEDKIKKIDEKMSQLKAQKQAIIYREKEKERKARTRRLIQLGALSEIYLKCTGIEPESFESYLKKIVQLQGFQDFTVANKKPEI